METNDAPNVPPAPAPAPAPALALAPGLHVVLGAGQIGPLLVDALLARGVRVRQVRLSARAPGPARPGLELVHGDLSDPAFARSALAGAAVVYHCLNARYDQWARLLLPLTRGVLAGMAGAAPGARLVMLDNLYMYDPADGPMREDSPVRPRSNKGTLRARQAEDVLGAHARGEVRVAIGRASDFFGPLVGNAILGERFWKKALAGRAVECCGDPDQPHSYSYSHDVAAGLLTLGAHDQAFGHVWHLPVNPATSTRELAQRLAGDAVEVQRLPDWMLRTMGVFAPIMREVAEMTYQWKLPFVLDDSRFRAAFGSRPTPPADAIAATIAWARASHAPAGRRAPAASATAPAPR